MAGNKGQQEDFDLNARIRMFDPDGSLAEESREVWSLIESKAEEIARAFWVEYGRAPELKSPLSESKMSELGQRIVPYLRSLHTNLHSPEWVERGGQHVAAATRAGVPPGVNLTHVARAPAASGRRPKLSPSWPSTTTSPVGAHTARPVRSQRSSVPDSTAPPCSACRASPARPRATSTGRT